MISFSVLVFFCVIWMQMWFIVMFMGCDLFIKRIHMRTIKTTQFSINTKCKKKCLSAPNQIFARVLCARHCGNFYRSNSNSNKHNRNDYLIIHLAGLPFASLANWKSMKLPYISRSVHGASGSQISSIGNRIMKGYPKICDFLCWRNFHSMFENVMFV